MENSYLTNFFIMRFISMVRMNVVTLFRNKNKSIASLSKNYSITIPLVVTEDIVIDQIMEVAKIMEIDTARKVQQIISRTTFDSAYDASLNNVLAFLPVRQVEQGTYGFSVTGILNGDTAGIITETTEVFKNQALDIEKMANLFDLTNANAISDMYIKEQVEDVLEADNILKHNKAHPTYVEVEIPYITGHGEIKVVKNTIQIEIVPRVVKEVDLATVLVDLDPAKLYKRFAKLQSKEISFVKEFLLEIDHIEKLAKLNAKEPNNILNFIRKENIKTKLGSMYNYPFAMLFMSQRFVDNLSRENGVDLNMDGELHKYLKRMMMMCALIYDESTDIMKTMFDGDRVSKSYQYDDFLENISRYEKELKQLVRLGGR